MQGHTIPHTHAMRRQLVCQKPLQNSKSSYLLGQFLILTLKFSTDCLISGGNLLGYAFSNFYKAYRHSSLPLTLFTLMIVICNWNKRLQRGYVPLINIGAKIEVVKVFFLCRVENLKSIYPTFNLLYFHFQEKDTVHSFLYKHLDAQ